MAAAGDSVGERHARLGGVEQEVDAAAGAHRHQHTTTQRLAEAATLSPCPNCAGASHAEGASENSAPIPIPRRTPAGPGKKTSRESGIMTARAAQSAVREQTHHADDQAIEGRWANSSSCRELERQGRMRDRRRDDIGELFRSIGEMERSELRPSTV